MPQQTIQIRPPASSDVTDLIRALTDVFEAINSEERMLIHPAVRLSLRSIAAASTSSSGAIDKITLEVVLGQLADIAAEARRGTSEQRELSRRQGVVVRSAERDRGLQ